MRRLVWALPVVLPVVPLACFNPGGPLTVTFEAGVLPEIEFGDSSVLLPDVFLFSPGEAGPPPEAEAGPPPVGMAKAKVISDLGPEPGVTLLITDSQGLPLGAPVKTDSTGVAQFPAPEGACVTAVLGSSNYHVVTYMAVTPGDNLTILDTTDPPSQPFNVNLTGVPSASYGNGAIVAGTCGNPQQYFEGEESSFGIDVSQGCYAAGVFPLLVSFPVDGGPNAYVFQKAVPMSLLFGTDADGSLTVPFSSTQSSQVGMQLVTATAPSEALAQYGVYLGYNEVANNVPYWVTNENPSSFGPDGGTASAGFESHPNYPDFVQSQATLVPQNGGGNGSPYLAVAQRQTGMPSGSQTLDLSGLPPLTVSANVLAGPNNATIAWSTSSPVPSTIGTLVHVSGCGPTWTLVVPPGVTAISSFQLDPALIEALFSGDECSVRYNVEILSGDGIADYTALKQEADVMVEMIENPASVDSCSDNNGVALPPLPNDGDLTVTGYEYGYYFGCS